MSNRSRATATNPTSGILLVDKPQGITSHDVVARVRRIVGTRRVGHAGTLDPIATGLLILGVNSSTRLLTWIVGLDKEYRATIRLGAASTTDDAEGELSAPVAPPTLAAISEGDLSAAVAKLTGKLSQRPSSVSAIKVHGKRAYALAREGAAVVLPARDVTVEAFEIVRLTRGEWIDIDVRVECSSGTYIRALARDLGDDLGVGGHLTALRRTRIGPFGVAGAAPIDDRLAEALRSPAEVAARLFPVLQVSAEQATDIANGKRISLDEPADALGGPIAVVTAEGRLVGLIELAEGRAKILVNFPPDHVAAQPGPEAGPA